MSCRHAASPRTLGLVVPGAAFLGHMSWDSPLSVCLLSDGEFAAQNNRLCASFLLFPFCFFGLFWIFFLEGCHFFHNVSEPGETSSYKQHAAL